MNVSQRIPLFVGRSSGGKEVGVGGPELSTVVVVPGGVGIPAHMHTALHRVTALTLIISYSKLTDVSFTFQFNLVNFVVISYSQF